MNTGRLIVAIVAAGGLIVSACVDEGPDSGEGSVDRSTTVPVTTAIDTPAEEAAPIALPSDFSLVGVTEAVRAAPADAVVQAFIALAGSNQSDPRFVELTLFEFPDASSTDDALASLAQADLADPTDVGGLSFGFLQTGGGPARPSRDRLQLVTHGPSVESIIQGRVDETHIVVGGARVLQAYQVDELLVGFDGTSFDHVDPGALPTMTVLADEPLPDGAVAEIESEDGSISIEIREGVQEGWFGYQARDVPIGSADGFGESLGGRVAIQPSSWFGSDGSALDPSRLFWWNDGRITVITYPSNLEQASLVELAEATRTWHLDELLALISERTGSNESSETDLDGNAAGDGAATEAEQQSPPLSAVTVSELQDFVEARRGVEIGSPVHFDFVEQFPTSGLDGFFVSNELWIVMKALGLVESGHTREAADQARVDRIRGVPGTVELQPTEAENKTVVVHELTHIVDVGEGILSPSSSELLDPGQALIEGNAHRIAFDYVATLTAEEQAAVGEFPALFPAGGDERLSRAMQDVLEFPYDEGRLFATALAELGGEQAIADAFERPPSSTEQILFPGAWLAEDEPVAVTPPDRPVGAQQLGQGTLGAYLLVLLLRAADANADLDLVAPWAGDGYLVYELDEQLCLEALIRMDSGVSAGQLATALSAPGREVARSANDLTLKSCADPAG